MSVLEIKNDLEKTIRVLLEELTLEKNSTITSLNRLDGTFVRDASSHFIITNYLGHPRVLVSVSPYNFPDTMFNVGKKNIKIREALCEKNRNPILVPIDYGYLKNRSFVIWPWCVSLGKNRLQKLRHKLYIKRQVLNWLLTLVNETSRSATSKEINELYKKSYEYLLENKDVKDIIKKWARDSLFQIESKTIIPYVVLQHGDLWSGNVMVKQLNCKNLFKKKFTVIDWGGSTFKGFPFSDLIYYCMKMKLSPKYCYSHIIKYDSSIPLRKNRQFNFEYYMIASLGFLGNNLGEFPYERYIKLTNDITEYLVSLHDLARNTRKLI